MFDEMTPSIIMAGFPMLDWIDIAMSPVCLPGEVDQNANIMYVDAAERMGLDGRCVSASIRRGWMCDCG